MLQRKVRLTGYRVESHWHNLCNWADILLFFSAFNSCILVLIFQFYPKTYGNNHKITILTYCASWTDTSNLHLRSGLLPGRLRRATDSQVRPGVQPWRLSLLLGRHRQLRGGLCRARLPGGLHQVRLLHSHWSRTYITALSLVESFPSDACASSHMP